MHNNMFMASQNISGEKSISGVNVYPRFGGNDVTVVYNGQLSMSGADQVYAHAGFGNQEQWNKVYDHRMEKTAQGWACTINMEDRQLNFCFKDSASNWDNNGGSNWIYVK